MIDTLAMRRAFVTGVALFTTAGCGNFSDDMNMMCDAPTHVTEGSPRSSERAQAISLYITERTRSAEARKLFQSLGAAEKDTRRKILEDAVRRAGIDPAACEMLREFE